MSHRLPPLNTLRVFDAVVRHMSFTRAAAELGMTQAAVSYQIKLLEDRTGQPMFRRLTRKLALTDAGARFAPAVADTFSRLQGAFAAITDQRDSVLAVSSVLTFTNNWLVPRIGRFQVAYPGLAVRIDSTTRLVDFFREEFDVGIRWSREGRGHWPGLASTHLFSVDLIPMCAPRLREEYPAAFSAEDLLKLPLLGEFSTDFPHPRGNDAEWRSWFRAADVEIQAMPPLKSYFATQPMLAAAALAGQGVALLTAGFFRAEIDAGRLIALSDVRLRDVESYYFVCQTSRRDIPKIKAFREWLIAEIAADGLR